MIEVQIISKILATKDIEWIRDKPYYDQPYLWEPYVDEYRYIYNHYIEFGEIMDTQKFLDKFEEFPLAPVEQSDESLLSEMDEQTLYKKVVPKLNKLNEYNDDSYKLVEVLTDVAQYGQDYVKSLKQVSYKLGDIADDYLNHLSESDYQKIKTGFDELDEEMQGGILCNKEVVAVLASSGAGKTWTMLKMSLAAWDCGKNVGIVSAEMDAVECLERMCTLKYHVNYNDVIARRHDNKMRELIQILKDKPIYILDPVSWQNRDTAYLKRWISQCDINALYIDGGQYVESIDKDEDKDWAKLMKMQRELYQISCEVKIPIVVSFQCNRNGTKDSRSTRKPPLPENIGESSKIVEACTKVLSIGRYDDEYKIVLTKSRKTKEGTIFVYNWDLVNGEYRFVRNEYYGETEEEARDRQRVDKQVQVSMDLIRKQRRGTARPDWERNDLQ